MSDLISRSELIDRFKQLKGSDSLANMFVADVIKEIKKQPVAYNLDEVVKNLEEYREEMKQFGSDGILTDIIDTVRSGGKG